MNIAKRILIATVACSFALPPGDRAQQVETSVSLRDNSDWWSGLRTIENDDVGQTQEREVSDSNLRISGIKLGEHFLEQAARKLGSTKLVHRGDAALGREQACYVSSDSGKKIYLIFEQGEVTHSFYLFTGGKTWTGQEYCAPSEQVNWTTSTSSGLRLGLTQIQVIAILGKPSLRRKDQLIYSLLISKKYTEKELEDLRKHHSDLSEDEFRRDYSSYDWSAGLEFKFENSKMTFMAVSWAETT